MKAITKMLVSYATAYTLIVTTLGVLILAKLVVEQHAPSWVMNAIVVVSVIVAIIMFMGEDSDE